MQRRESFSFHFCQFRPMTGGKRPQKRSLTLHNGREVIWNNKTDGYIAQIQGEVIQKLTFWGQAIAMIKICSCLPFSMHLSRKPWHHIKDYHDNSVNVFFYYFWMNRLVYLLIFFSADYDFYVKWLCQMIRRLKLSNNINTACWALIF